MTDLDRLDPQLDESLIHLRKRLYRYWRQHLDLDKEKLQEALQDRIVEAVEMVEYQLQREGLLDWEGIE